jgi:hypothetical protein
MNLRKSKGYSSRPTAHTRIPSAVPTMVSVKTTHPDSRLCAAFVVLPLSSPFIWAASQPEFHGPGIFMHTGLHSPLSSKSGLTTSVPSGVPEKVVHQTQNKHLPSLALWPHPQRSITVHHSSTYLFMLFDCFSWGTTAELCLLIDRLPSLRVKNSLLNPRD